MVFRMDIQDRSTVVHGVPAFDLLSGSSQGRREDIDPHRYQLVSWR